MPRPLRYTRYLNVPLTSELLAQLEDLKWRTKIDKSDAARRFIAYLLLLDPAAQDRILHSFDNVPEHRRGRLKVWKGKRGRKKKVDHSPPDRIVPNLHTERPKTSYHPDNAKLKPVTENIPLKPGIATAVHPSKENPKPKAAPFLEDWQMTRIKKG